MSWHRESRRHSLSRYGVKTGRKKYNTKRTEVPDIHFRPSGRLSTKGVNPKLREYIRMMKQITNTRNDEYVDLRHQEFLGDYDDVERYVEKELLYPEWLGRIRGKDRILNYPDGLKIGDRVRYNEDMFFAESPEERYEIYQRWKEWKEMKGDRRDRYIYRIIKRVDGDSDIYIATNKNVPPEGYRWIGEDDEEYEYAKDNISRKLEKESDSVEIVPFESIDEFNKTHKKRSSRRETQNYQRKTRKNTESNLVAKREKEKSQQRPKPEPRTSEPREKRIERKLRDMYGDDYSEEMLRDYLRRR